VRFEVATRAATKHLFPGDVSQPFLDGRYAGRLTAAAASLPVAGRAIEPPDGGPAVAESLVLTSPWAQTHGNRGKPTDTGDVG